MSNKVLELNTLAPARPTVKVSWSGMPDGKLYEMAVFDDINLLDQQFLFSRGAQLEEILEIRDRSLTEDEQDQLKLIVNTMARIVLPGLPDEALEELNDMHKVKLIEAFTVASPEISARVERLKAGKK